MRDLTEDQGNQLLELARKSIKEEFNDINVNLEDYSESIFNEKRGVFVTLKINGLLRGCIGVPFPKLKLKEAVYESGKNAAFNDPRFPPLNKEEFEKVEIEISVLTLPQETNSEEIEIGEDGLICEFEGRQGLLLPQVATENNFSKEEFLECLCGKAGLEKNKWKDSNFKLKKFQCRIFSE